MARSLASGFWFLTSGFWFLVSAMEIASRIVSVVLGLAVMVLLLWPITVPVGFGEVWWASRQAQSRAKTPPAPRPQPEWARPASLPAPGAKPSAPSPTPTPHAVMPNQAVPKPAEAPREQSEQLAALTDQDKTGAVTPKDTTKRYYRVKVRDGGTLQSGKVVIRLSGIAAREADATCKDAHGKSWPCGAAAKAALTRLIRARAVTCVLPKGGEHNIFDASCSVAGTDLSTWLVRQGWATPKEPNEAALAKAAEAAKSERLGLWRAAE
jgi:endonuclease YncB( thermonuclease family)